MKVMPAGLKPYRRTPEFTRATTPARLLQGHTTQAGVWARIVVLDGSMTYRILEPELEEIVLDSKTERVIESQIRHEIVPHDGVRFYVEFHRIESAAPLLNESRQKP